ncbi:MAG: hypothetical protein ACOZNI_09405 [Myxococcota bacterium]
MASVALRKAYLRELEKARKAGVPCPSAKVRQRSRDGLLLPDVQRPSRKTTCDKGDQPAFEARRRHRLPSIAAPGRVTYLLPRFALTASEEGDYTASLLEQVRKARRDGVTILRARKTGDGVLAASGPPAPPAGPDDRPWEADKDDDDGTCRERLTFGYRTVQFVVWCDWFSEWEDCAWALQHQGDFYASLDLASAPHDVIEALWWPFYDGWGPPIQVFKYSLALLYTYPDYIGAGPSAYQCAGLGDFVKGLLAGKTMDNKDGSDRCTWTVNFRNKTSDGYRAYESCSFGSQSCDKEYRSGAGCEGLEWDEYTNEWVSEDWCYNGDPDVSGCDWPGTPVGCNSVMNTSLFDTTAHPYYLAWSGEVCDAIMYLSWMAWDFSFYALWARSGVGIEALDASAKIARYALKHVAKWSGTFLHELGHVYLPDKEDDTHCDSNCCSDQLAKGWQCALRAHLGLPTQFFEPNELDDDYSEDDRFERDAPPCGGGNDLYNRVMGWQCYAENNGIAGSSYEYCSTGCGYEWLDPNGDTLFFIYGSEVYLSADAFLDGACGTEPTDEEDSVPTATVEDYQEARSQTGDVPDNAGGGA